MSFQIIIGADVVPTASNIEAVQKDAPDFLFGGLREI